MYCPCACCSPYMPVAIAACQATSYIHNRPLVEAVLACNISWTIGWTAVQAGSTTVTSQGKPEMSVRRVKQLEELQARVQAQVKQHCSDACTTASGDESDVAARGHMTGSCRVFESSLLQPQQVLPGCMAFM